MSDVLADETSAPSPFVLNAWYVCAWPDEIGSDKALARTICGHAMVLFRDASGQPAALEDRCCHRQMPLSLGQVAAGTIRCGYHGLCFDASGRCVEIPGQPEIPAAARVRAFPTVERYGWIWVWPGAAQLADAGAVPSIYGRNDDPDWTAIGGTLHVKGNYQLITDNLLDLTHETFVHPDSLGNRAVVEHPIEVKNDTRSVVVERWMLNHDPAPHWKANLRRKLGTDVLADRWQLIRFEPPAYVVLDVGVAPAGTGAREGNRSQGCEGCNMNAITPETGQSSWYFWASARKFLRDDSTLSKTLQESVTRIFEQDRIAIEAVQQVMNRTGNRPVIHVRADKGQNIARRMVAAMLDHEQALEATGSHPEHSGTS